MQPGKKTKTKTRNSAECFHAAEQKLLFLAVLPLGPAYDLSFSEVRSHSLVILWKAPVYIGASAVTGYFVDMAKKGSSEFVTLNQEAVRQRYLQVSSSSSGLWSRCSEAATILML